MRHRVSCWSSRMWFHILITATCTACTRWANTETALSSTHKKKQKNKKKTACNTGESWCAKFQVRVSFSKRSISFNASCENIIKRLTNYQWCQIFSAWTLQSVAWVTKQFSRTAGNRFWKTSKHGGGIISEERRAPATGSGVDADALLLYQDCLTSQNQRPQNWTQN